MLALPLEPVSVLALSTLLLLASGHDLRVRKIPNTLVLWGVLTALVLSLTPRGIGVLSAVLGGMTGFLVFLLLHLFRMVGAGDVKLVAAVGMFVGWPDTVQLCMAILIAGGLLATAYAVWTCRWKTVLRNLHAGLMQLIRLGQWPGFGQPLFSEVSPERLPYALAVGLGTVGYYAVML